MNAGLILCGGRSRRMGRDKATLPFGDQSLLERVAGILSPIVDELWLVAREGQEIGLELPIARDPAEGRGPLAGIAAGLRVIESDRAFVASCDVPLLLPGFVERMLELSDGYDAAILRADGHWMTTTAVYGRTCLPAIEALLARDERRPRALLEVVSTRIVEASDLLDVDPDLRSVEDCDTPEDYRRSLALAGIEPPPHSL